jgi:hypothetical protein
MAQDEKTKGSSGEQTTGRLGERTVLKSPLSVIKMDVSELRAYTQSLNEFLKTPGAAAMKICECCINVD